MSAAPLLVAYYRVSTDRQGRSGLGLDAQRAAVRAHAKLTRAKIAAEYTEVESGARRDRPELARAIAAARAAGAELVVAKLDRLTRDVRLLLEIADGGVPLRCLDIPELPADPAVARMLLTILAAFAEFERRRMAARAREANAARVARGERLGWRGTRRNRNPLTPALRLAGAKLAGAALRRRAAAHRAACEPLARGLAAGGMSRAEVAAELNARGLRTLCGLAWTPARVEWLLRPRPPAT